MTSRERDMKNVVNNHIHLNGLEFEVDGKSVSVTPRQPDGRAAGGVRAAGAAAKQPARPTRWSQEERGIAKTNQLAEALAEAQAAREIITADLGDEELWNDESSLVSAPDTSADGSSLGSAQASAPDTSADGSSLGSALVDDPTLALDDDNLPPHLFDTLALADKNSLGSPPSPAPGGIDPSDDDSAIDNSAISRQWTGGAHRVGGYTRGGTPQTPDNTNPQTIRRALDLAPASEHAALLSDKTDWNRSTRVEQASTPSFDHPDQETMRRIDTAQSASKYSSLKSAARTASSWVSIARRQSESPPVLTNSAGLMAGSHSAFQDISPVATVTPKITRPKKKKGQKPKWRG